MSNINIIIPIGGKGERFKKQNFLLPKPLINFLGKPLIFWLLDNLKIDKKTKIHIPYNYELDEYNFVDIIKNNYPNHNIIFYKLDFITRGAAETVYSVINNLSKKELTKKVLIIDYDNIYLDDIINKFDHINNNCIFYFNDYSDKEIFSYIKICDNNIIDIKEKEKISNNANCGVYGFRNGDILKKSIENIVKNNNKANNEFYISELYKFIINNYKDETVKAIKIKKYFCLGAPELLKLNSFKLIDIQEKKRFCFDLDNTLVTYPTIKGDYTTVLPIERNISFLNFLFSLGHEIIIYTARRMKTHKGNIGKITKDIGSITLDTLNRFGINYHEIYFGKPYADFYFDDLAFNSFSDLEKATGFYNLHIQPRDDNYIEFKQSSVIKKTKDLSGIINYYKNIPNELIHFFPKLINYDDNYIELEKINGLTLSQLYVNNCFTTFYIDKIIHFFDLIHNEKVVEREVNYYDNYYNKTLYRLNNYKCNFKNYDETKKDILFFLKKYEKEDKSVLGMIHGDPVLTNIILNEDGELKFIDMRGKQGKNNSIFGDIFYDYAKVYQSLIGYDEILLNKKVNNLYKNEIISYFENIITKKFGEESLLYIKWITKSLLISLLPIHNNEKCVKYYNLIHSIK